MSDVKHHIADDLLAAYVSGALPHPYAIVVASHISMCDECRVRHEAQLAVGGSVLETLETTEITADMKARVMDLLDDTPAKPAIRVPRRQGIYPGPVVEALKGGQPKWRSLGMGVKQSILFAGEEGSVRLLYIPGGQAVPEHGHNGLEMTLVLQGAFSDEGGRYGVGDVEVTDEHVDHVPTAEPGPACICLAATDAPLRFKGFVPRLLQPVFGI
ncbi:Anti-sigma-E factor ChrR [Pseudoruegeria aquimaris]|uniref:Anti-sigma-E factor ChrR n=1 Tax=Pseudoruegeria aquimaris TaxID=393663 RepID=A0A1Y5TL90_9RHOB|nr:ChrR family anti-sigma-E factor [Pseudoruegeria aquimaris]SLN66600.1 Anti-sigma-E factor ChrR [Pseudoruegeria aquimaris]